MQPRTLLLIEIFVAAGPLSQQTEITLGKPQPNSPFYFAGRTVCASLGFLCLRPIVRVVVHEKSTRARLFCFAGWGPIVPESRDPLLAAPEFHVVAVDELPGTLFGLTFRGAP